MIQTEMKSTNHPGGTLHEVQGKRSLGGGDKLRYQRGSDSYPPKADTSNPQGLLINYSPISFGSNVISSIVLMGKLRLRNVK